jgi:glucose/arabinose dehydrogenase
LCTQRELRRLWHELAWPDTPGLADNVGTRLRPGRLARVLVALLVAALVAGCGSGSGDRDAERTVGTTANRQNSLPLEVTEVATGLETPWSLAWDPQGRLWFTERPGRLTRLGGETRTIEGVVENGEAGLAGLEFDQQGRPYLMYTAADENRIVRLEPDGTETILVDGIAAASFHDGGRLRFGPNGMLYACGVPKPASAG